MNDTERALNVIAAREQARAWLAGIARVLGETGAEESLWKVRNCAAGHGGK